MFSRNRFFAAPFFAITFVFGTWCVQHMAQLPSVKWLIFSAIFVCVIFFLVGFNQFFCKKKSLLFFHRKPALKYLRLAPTLQSLFLAFATFLLAIIWASVQAHWRLSDHLPHEWEQKTIVLQGVVAGVPEVTERGERFQFVVEKVLTPQADVPKNISLNFYHQQAFADQLPESTTPQVYVQTFHAGERWQFSVKLKRPHGALNPHGFDFEAWALSENMRATGNIKAKAGMKKLDTLVWQPTYLIAYIREIIKQKIAKLLVGQPYVGVIQALVMGDDSQISAQDWQVFLRTGITHLISISGLHITMLAGLGFMFTQSIWRRVPKLTLKLPARKAATFAGVLVAFVYALLAGFSVPTQRTFYMLMVFAIALWSSRQWTLFQVLCMALLVVVVIDPWAVNAAGFWLSFGAVGLIGYALNGRVQALHWLKTALITQWAVTIGMLPILLMLFNQTSIISPVANALAIPVVSFVVTPLALLGSFLPFEATYNSPLFIANQAFNWLMHALLYLNSLPITAWHQASPPLWTLFIAIFGVLFILLPRGVPLRFLGFLGLIPMMLIKPESPNLGEMNVTVLDVGQGLSVLVQTKNHTLIYDTGPKFNAQSDAGSRIILPYLHVQGVEKLDGLVVSHDDIDHSGGRDSLLQAMPVDWVLSSFDAENSNSKAIKQILCHARQHWTWDAVNFEVLYPIENDFTDADIKDNNKSCVIKVTSKMGSLLLTGDIEKEAENVLLAEYVETQKLSSDVLVVPHHGSKTSSQLAFVQAVSPKISVFTVGYLNRFGHPKPDVVSRYQGDGASSFRSDHDGAVLLDFYQNALKQDRIKMVAWRAAYQRYWLDPQLKEHK